MCNSAVTLVNRLLQLVPELSHVYDAHIDDNDELLPHVFFGDVTRFVVQQVGSGAGEPPAQLIVLLDCLEHSMACGNEDVQKLISVSFLEDLVDYVDVVALLQGLLGPALSRELGRHAGW